MAQRVAGDLYHDLDGQLHEIKRQLRQLSGYPFDPEDLRRHLKSAIEGKFDAVSAPIFVHDKTKDGWKLLENVSRRLTSVRDLELVSFLMGNESSVNGEEVVRRARILDVNYSQEDAEWLLANQNEIPVEFRKYYLVFTGTVWQDSISYRNVSCLGWYGRRWCLLFSWLDDDWYSYGRLVRPRK